MTAPVRINISVPAFVMLCASRVARKLGWTAMERIAIRGIKRFEPDILAQIREAQNNARKGFL
jgi:hypothetical protein